MGVGGVVGIVRLGVGLLQPTSSNTISFRSEADSGVGDSLGAITPGTIVNGDLLLPIVVYLNDNASTTPGTVTCTPPSGFTSFSKNTFNFTGGGAVANQQINLEIFTKFALNESGGYTFTFSNNDAGAAAYSNLIFLVYSGVNRATPIGASLASTGGPSSTSLTSTANGVTIGRSNSLLLWIFAGLSTSSTFPSGFTTRANNVDGVQGVAEFAAGYGPTGNKTGTVAGDAATQNGYIAQLISLNPLG